MHEVYHIFVHSSPGNGRCHFWILAAAFRRRCRTTSFKTQLVAVQILIPSKTVASMNQRASLCMSWLPGKPANPPIGGVLFTRATPSSHPYFNSIIHVPWFVYHPFRAWGNPLTTWKPRMTGLGDRSFGFEVFWDPGPGEALGGPWADDLQR